MYNMPMSYKIISKKLIIIVPIVFVLVSIVRIYLNYTQNQEAMRYFISEQSRLIDSLYMAHRNYYQNLYLKKY
jgi:hypothetical protein